MFVTCKIYILHADNRMIQQKLQIYWQIDFLRCLKIFLHRFLCKSLLPIVDHSYPYG